MRLRYGTPRTRRQSREPETALCEGQACGTPCTYRREVTFENPRWRGNRRSSP